MRRRTPSAPRRDGEPSGHRAVRPRVGVVILNWNAWQYTVECLESVLRVEGVELEVVVCDNDSGDGSAQMIRDWAAGRLVAPQPDHPALRACVAPPLPKPLRLVEYDRATAETGGAKGESGARLVLVHNGGNLGFAGGNNVAIRYFLARGDVDYVWLLNNDTVVPPDALVRMVEHMAADERVGICGSTLLYYADPQVIQARGGFRYNKWRGTSRQLDQFQHAGPVSPEHLQRIEEEMDGVQGASALVTRRFLERVGLLSEDYFLYYEEQDWAVRARRAGYRVAFAPGSVVYHREGATTGGSSRRPADTSETSDYHAIRSRLLFTRKFYPQALPLIYLSLAPMVMKRLARGQPSRARMIARLTVESLRSLLKRPGSTSG